jgi:hypothetical protein
LKHSNIQMFEHLKHLEHLTFEVVYFQIKNKTIKEMIRTKKMIRKSSEIIRNDE